MMAVLIGGLVYAWWRGLPLSSFLREGFGEPAAWRTWYPRRLRRRNNVWDRLPPGVRCCRLLFGVGVGGVVVVVFPMLMYVAAGQGPPGWLGFLRGLPRGVRLALILTPFAAALGLVAAFLSMSWIIPARLKRRGLTQSEANRFALGAPLSSPAFWSRPTIAALLQEEPRQRAANHAGDASTHVETRTMAGSGDERHQRV
jgi:hypothetical protein